jgi:predicted enzyme involved in methoxymalonyl-ACP biosynthesis
MKELELPAKFAFAPYNQVFQQLLDPASLLSGNLEGVNVVLLRLTDCLRFEEGATEAERKSRIERAAFELVSAMQAAAGRAQAPFLVCVCPSQQKLSAEPGWAEFLENIEQQLVSKLSQVPRVRVITSAQIFELYPVDKYEDEYADKLGHIPYLPEFFVALATMLARRILSLRSAPKKVIVLDCNNTLWEGDCNAEGPSGVRVDGPRRALQEFMLNQLEAGTLLCLCSKNTEADIDAVFAHNTGMLLQPEHIISRRLGLDSAALGLQQLAEELQLDRDSLIFLSGDPDECSEAVARCPEKSQHSYTTFGFLTNKRNPLSLRCSQAKTGHWSALRQNFVILAASRGPWMQSVRHIVRNPPRLWRRAHQSRRWLRAPGLSF